MEHKKPEGFEKELSDYGVVLYDSFCGEPTAWGYKILTFLGEDRFGLLYEYGEPRCASMGVWVLVIKTLTREEAIEKYGVITEEVFGPRGGWKSVRFGEKIFISPYLRPAK